MNMKETFRLMCEDGGWKDGLILLASTFGGYIAMILLCSMYS